MQVVHVWVFLLQSRGFSKQHEMTLSEEQLQWKVSLTQLSLTNGTSQL